MLGKVLELQRGALNLNQKELADRLGVSQSAWSRVETGQSSLAVEEFAAAARALKAKPEELLGRVHRSIEQLQQRGVNVLMTPAKASDETAAFVGGTALAALLLAILAGGKK